MPFYYNILFCRAYVFKLYFDKRLANLLVPDKSSVMGMILFTELTAHLSSFIFVDIVAYCKLCLSLESFIYIYLELWDDVNIEVVSQIFILVSFE